MKDTFLLRTWSQLSHWLGFGLPCGCAAILLGLVSMAAAPKETPTAGRQEYVHFKLINDRNIFNANRSAKSGRGGGADARRTARVHTITLVGTMVYDEGEKGPFAFFDGSSSEYKKVLEPGKSIAGYKVSQVTSTGVKLESGSTTLELRVGMQLRREEEGEWQLAGNNSPTSAAGSSNSATSSASEPAGEESDIVKRLMQQREQELK